MRSTDLLSGDCCYRKIPVVDMGGRVGKVSGFRFSRSHRHTGNQPPEWTLLNPTQALSARLLRKHEKVVRPVLYLLQRNMRRLRGIGE